MFLEIFAERQFANTKSLVLWDQWAWVQGVPYQLSEKLSKGPQETTRVQQEGPKDL